MTWRLRRVKNWGPVKFTLSRRGLGASIGDGVVRLGASPDGKIRETVRIPDTGIYRVDTIGRWRETAPTVPLPTVVPRRRGVIGGVIRWTIGGFIAATIVLWVAAFLVSAHLRHDDQVVTPTPTPGPVSTTPLDVPAAPATPTPPAPSPLPVVPPTWGGIPTSQQFSVT